MLFLNVLQCTAVIGLLPVVIYFFKDHDMSRSGNAESATDWRTTEKEQNLPLNQSKKRNRHQLCIIYYGKYVTVNTAVRPSIPYSKAILAGNEILIWQRVKSSYRQKMGAITSRHLIKLIPKNAMPKYFKSFLLNGSNVPKQFLG